MRAAFLIFLFAKPFLALATSIEGDNAFNLLNRVDENSQQNQIDDKPANKVYPVDSNGDNNLGESNDNKAVPLDNYLQPQNDKALAQKPLPEPVQVEYRNQWAPFVLNPVKPRAILVIQPIYKAQGLDNSQISNDAREVAIAVKQSDDSLANPNENAAKPVDILAKPYDNNLKSDEIAARPVESFAKSAEGAENIDDSQVKPEEIVVKPYENVAKPDENVVKSDENVAKPDEKVPQPGEKIEKPDETNAKPIEYGVKHDKTALKEFLSKLFGNKENPQTSVREDLKAPVGQIEQVKLPDYDFLLAYKPFYDALLIERGLLNRVNKLEKIIDNGLPEPNLNADKLGYSLEEEMYKKDFILGIVNIKTEILKFLNWRTAKRLRNLYSGIKLGNYEYKPMPTADFYKEIKHLLKMVRLADIIVDMERINILEDNNKKISQFVPENPSNDDIPVVEKPSMAQYDVDKDNNVPKYENVKPNDEITDVNQRNTIKIIEIGDKTDQDANNVKKMLAASPNDDIEEKKEEPVEDIDHPEYSTDEDIFPYWMLWIMEQKFKLQNIHHKNKRSGRWTFLHYGSIFNSNYDEAAILKSDNVAAILNSNKIGIIQDSNKLKTILNLVKLKNIPNLNKICDKQNPTDDIFISNNIQTFINSKHMESILNSDEDAILSLKRKRAIWSLKKIGQILNSNRVGGNRPIKIKVGGYRNSNNKGNFISYKNKATILKSDEEAILNSKRKRAIWSLKKIGQILNSNRIGDNRKTKIVDGYRNSNNKGNFLSYKKMAAISKTKRISLDLKRMDLSHDSLINSRHVEMLDQVSNIQPIKRGFSMLTRLKLFSLLSDGYTPQRRIFLPKDPVIYLKNNKVISAETRAMLRPAGVPLRWG